MFKKILSILLISLTLIGCNNSKDDQEYNVYVESEFAPLKKVILSCSILRNSMRLM